MSIYPTHKPSGIEWLGDIPEHWISTRVKNALVFDIGGTPSRNKMEYFDGDNLWVSIADLNNQDLITDTNEKITDEAIEDSNCKLIPKDSLLFSFKLSVGHLAFAGSNLYTNEAIAAFRPSNRLNVRFLKYLLQIEFESNANTNIYGAYLFNKETLGAAKIVFPDDSKEQTAIANYLDDKTSKLDQLISNKKAQIEKLKEIRQIEINTAVTKGLDPNVKLKPSGIDWLGSIPEHWEVKRLKNVSTNVQTGTTPKTAILKYYEQEDIKWFTPVDFTKNIRLTDSKNKISQIAIDEGAGRLFPSGSVLLLGIGATIGKIGLITEDSSSNQQINCITFTTKIDSLFAAFSLKIYETEIIKIANFSTMPIFNQSNTANLNIGIPPITEQTAIANYLDEKTSKIDQLVSNLENQIEQLQEIRKIEIYNAVTGKIKVAAA